MTTGKAAAPNGGSTACCAPRVLSGPAGTDGSASNDPRSVRSHVRGVRARHVPCVHCSLVRRFYGGVLMNFTPSQIEYARRHRERLRRIAAAAIESPLSQMQRQPDIVVLPASDEPEPTPSRAIRVMWLDDEDRISVERIKRVVAREFGVSVIDLESPRRDVKSA